MRRRFTVVIVSVVAGSLLVAGLGTVVLVRAQERRATRQDLVQLASNWAGATRLLGPARVTSLRAFLRRTQDLDIVQIPPLASDRLPRGIRAGDVDTAALASGHAVSGFDATTAYAIVPFFSLGGRPLAVAVSQPTSRLGAGATYFLLSAAVALAVAAIAGEALARRVVRPLVTAEAATRRIADGDLSTRLTPPDGSGEELVALAESINSMAARLEQARGREREFFMSVSHDLRTPLTSIRGYAEALADGTASDAGRAAEVIASEARRLERLVRDLLDLAKLEAAGFSLEPQRVDLFDVVADTAAGFTPAAERLGLRLDVREPAEPCTVAVDPDRMAQVVANLVENAMKFAAGRIVLATWPTAAGDTPLAQVTVDDDGPGIAPQDLPHIFDRLWTSPRGPVRQVGSGLGLAIVAELVRAMGGTVEAQSPVPGGAGGTRLIVTVRRAPGGHLPNP